jgi:hypothetical protein
MAGQAHLDHAARQLGFPDYATYSAYQQKQAAMRMQNGISGTGMEQGGAPPQNWLQHLLASIPGHPAQLLGYVDERMGKALGGK